MPETRSVEEYIRLWPASLIGVGVIKLWQSREGLGGAFGGFMFTVAGTWLLLEQAGVSRLSLAGAQAGN